MAINIHEEYVRLYIQAVNRATAPLLEASAQLDAFQANITKASIATGAIGIRLAVVGGIGAVGLGLLADQGARFQQTMAQVAANTNMSNATMAVMQRTVLQLQSTTGSAASELAQGFMHITNLGFSAADAVQVLSAANESAVSTGTSVASVANVLALQLHDFGLKASDAGRAMNVLHTAAALGNATLEQFVSSTSRAVTTAANFHQPLVQVDAALSALSRHMDISQASTALAGLYDKIAVPAKSVVTILQTLDRQNPGLHLVQDFTPAGLASRTLQGVLQDLAKATRGNSQEMLNLLGVTNPTAAQLKTLSQAADGNAGAILKLVPAMRGGLAAMVLLGTGAKDLTNSSLQLNAAWSGKIDPTMTAFQRQQATLAGQLQDLRGALESTAVVIGLGLVPAVLSFLRILNPIVSAVEGWIKANSGVLSGWAPWIVGAITVAALLLIVASVILKVIAGFKNLMTVLGLVKDAFTAVGLGIFGTELGIFAAGLFAVVLVGLVLYKQWSQFRDVVNSIWSLALTNPLGNILEGFVQANPGLLLIAAAFKTIYDRVKPVHDLVLRLITMVRQLITEMSHIPVVQGLGNAAGTVLNFAGVNPGAAGSAASTAAQAAGNAANTALNFTGLPSTLAGIERSLQALKGTQANTSANGLSGGGGGAGTARALSLSDFSGRIAVLLPQVTAQNNRLLPPSQSTTPTAGPTTNHITVNVPVTNANISTDIDRRKLGETISEAIAEAFGVRVNTPIRANSKLPGAR